MKRTIYFAVALLGLTLGTFITGCGGGPAIAAPPPNDAITVSVSASIPTVQAAGMVPITATVNSDPSNKGVTWSVSCGVSQCGNVSPSSSLSGAPATYNAPTTPPPSDLTVTIKATAVANTSKSGAASVTVSAITISASPTTAIVQATGSLAITAVVNNDPTNSGVTWAISPASGAGTLSNTSTSSVTYNAPNTPPTSALVVTITATSVTDTSKSASVTVTVPTVVVSVAPTTATVQGSGTQPFTATVQGDPAHKGVTWSLSPASGAGSLTNPTTTAVTYNAPSTPPANDLTVTVTATSVADPLASSSAIVTVPAIAVSITNGPQPPRVQIGGTSSITATVANDPSHQGVNWTVSCSGAPCGSVAPTSSLSGAAVTYTASSTPPPSDLDVIITATSVADTSKAASAIVTVLAVTVLVSPGSALIPVNATTQLNATKFTAAVGNDPNNKGVSWALTQGTTACSPGCGTVAPASTGSGAATTYTAPPTVPANAMVTLTATSVTDPTKTTGATITLTVGTVKLVPANLSFGTVRVGATSLPLTTTLTNTGAGTLNISAVNIAGANPGDFFQTNTCIPSVGTGNSCGITVTFKPTVKGSRFANVSITDDSAGSPQLVGLSGKGCVIIRGKCITTASLNLAVQSALAAKKTSVVPRPSGPGKVGTRVIELVDSTRDDPYLANGAKRDLLVRFWYPASVAGGCKPAEYTPPMVWNYFSQLLGISLPRLTTNSCLNAPITEGAHPVVVFTHGYTGTFTDYTFLFEDLASRGYVVASVDHTYEATAVDFPDGRFVKSVFGSHLGKTVRNDEEAFSFAVSVRLGDLKFVVNELERLNASPQSPFLGQLDMASVAVAGHSIGGLTALLSLQQEPRFRAGIFIDGVVPDSVFSATKKPVLILTAGREQWGEDECRLWGELRGPRLAVNLRASEHVTPTDAVWLAKGVIKTGTAGTEKTVSAIRDYIAAFLDVNLRGKPVDPLLDGPSADYPDADVTTPTRSLCGEAMPSHQP